MSNHDELMSNFFAQPDALALGKTAEELKALRWLHVFFEHVATPRVAHELDTGCNGKLARCRKMPLDMVYEGEIDLNREKHRKAIKKKDYDIQVDTCRVFWF